MPKVRSMRFVLGCATVASVSGSLLAQVPVLTKIQTPYANLPSQVTMAGQTWAPGSVAYGPINTPLLLTGQNLGTSASNGTVIFVPYNSGVTGSAILVPPSGISSWSSNAISLTVPSGTFPGVIEVVTATGESNQLPFIVMPGNYATNIATCNCPSLPPTNQFQITTTSLPTGSVGGSYSTSLSAANGSGTLTWTLTGNALPVGLTLSSSGVISGIPNDSVGPLDLSFEVVDSQSHVADSTLSIAIGAPPPYVGSATIYSFSIANGTSGGYDPVGNVMSFSDSVTGTWSMAVSNGVSGYDHLNRLTSANATAGPYENLQMSWGYDSFGNRLSESTLLSGNANSNMPPVPANSSTTYNGSNKIQSSSLMLGAAPVYDAAGNIQEDNKNVYAYDGDGRVCAVTPVPLAGGSVVTQYLYDADGMRIAKGTASLLPPNGPNSPYVLSCDITQNGFTVTNSYILGLAGEQLTELHWTNGSPSFGHTNVFATGAGLVATYDTSNYQSLPANEGIPLPAMHLQFGDWLGSRRVQTNYGGYTEMTYMSLPYGDGLFSTGGTNCSAADYCYSEDATELHYTGKERDAESGNDHFDARYFGSSMGRFLSPDWSEEPDTVPYAEFENPQTLNLYSYAKNNPLLYNDPDGHSVQICDNNGQCRTVDDDVYKAAQQASNSSLNGPSLSALQSSSSGAGTLTSTSTDANGNTTTTAVGSVKWTADNPGIQGPAAIQAFGQIGNQGMAGIKAFTVGSVAIAGCIVGCPAAATVAGTAAVGLFSGLRAGMVIGGFIMTAHAVEQAEERGVTREEIEEAVEGVAKSNPVNGWDSVQRFYTATCEVRVNKITGTIVTVISKIKR
jgi:RHS repeat-associated protein